MSEKRLSGEEANPPATASSDATAADQETLRENLRASNPNGFVDPHGQVSVERAEAEFAALQREFTTRDREGLHLAKTQSRASRISRVSKKARFADVEKDGSGESTSTEEGGQFDLEATLKGEQAAESEAGIKPKHIGVIWDKLTVTGAGGVTNFVKT